MNRKVIVSLGNEHACYICSSENHMLKVIEYATKLRLKWEVVTSNNTETKPLTHIHIDEFSNFKND